MNGTSNWEVSSPLINTMTKTLNTINIFSTTYYFTITLVFFYVIYDLLMS